jgi:hypothetical protein
MLRATNRRTTEKYRILAILGGMAVVALTVLVVGMMLTGGGSAQSSVQLDTVTVNDPNATVSEVHSVPIGATVGYEYSVPDAEQYTVELLAGPNEDELEVVAWDYENNNVPGEHSGTMQLSGDLTDLEAFTADDFEAALGESKDSEVVVGVNLTVERENGETETTQVTETATITVSDPTEFVVSVGGDVELDVEGDE